MLRIIILIFLMVQLSGCFIAPGMRMRSTPAQVNNNIKPTFIPITVDLVQQMDQTRRYDRNDTYYYRVGPYDVLNIYVWGHPELSAPVGQMPAERSSNSNPTLEPVGYLVSPDGTIYFPLVGTVHVAGKTIEENRNHLASLLRKYIRRPQVDVRVTVFRSRRIYVMGEVKKPGMQPINDKPSSITEAINLADGLIDKSADPSHIFVIRGDYARPRVYWLNAESPDALLLGENFRLQPNDVVFVSTAGVSLWNRAIEQILPTIQTAWFTYSLIRNN